MFRQIRVKTQLFPALILVVAAVLSVGSSSEVMESRSQYSCCKPELEFDQDREYTWTVNEQTIAHVKGEKHDCADPCKKIEGGVMTLETCRDVNATEVWTNENKVTVEKRTYYSAQSCPGSLSGKMAPGNQVFVGVLLLVVLIGGLFVSQMTR